MSTKTEQSRILTVGSQNVDLSRPPASLERQKRRNAWLMAGAILLTGLWVIFISGSKARGALRAVAFCFWAATAILQVIQVTLPQRASFVRGVAIGLAIALIAVLVFK